MPDNPQPRPGPSPTPSPKPAAAIEIGNIISQSEGAIIVPSSQWLPSFQVDQDYLDTCSPQVGGFFVEFEESVAFMSATAFNERYGV